MHYVSTWFVGKARTANLPENWKHKANNNDYVVVRYILLPHLFAKFIHLRKVSDGGASERGGVLHQHQLAPVPLHLDHLAPQGPGWQRVEASHVIIDPVFVCNITRVDAIKSKLVMIKLYKLSKHIATDKWIIQYKNCHFGYCWLAVNQYFISSLK